MAGDSEPLLPKRGGNCLDDALLVFASVGSGALAGLYFIFSVCVMPSLDQIAARDKDPAGAIRTMQTINVVILNNFFLGLFMGIPLLCCVLCLRASGKLGQSSFSSNNNCRRFLVIGAALCLLLGEFGVTASLNVPLNDELAKVKLGKDARHLAEVWQGLVFFLLLVADFVPNNYWHILWANRWLRPKISNRYSNPWTFWNTVRMGFSFAAAAGFAWALRC